MLLVAALHEHRGPLSASLLSVYQIRLGHTEVGFVELAELVEHLPAGCAFWRSFGGPLAWSDDQHMLVRIEYRLRELQWMQAGKGQRPEPMSPPPFAYEAQDEESKLSRAQSKFEARFGK